MQAAQSIQQLANQCQCTGQHSGSHRLSVMRADLVQCNGCMAYYTAEQLQEALATKEPTSWGKPGVRRKDD